MTVSLLLDTDIVSDLYKGRQWAERYLPSLKAQELAICFMTVAELYKWGILRGWGASRIESLRSWVRSYTIVPYDEEMAKRWARISAECEKAGRRINSSDAWIAAAALKYKAFLMTRNIKHFEAAELHCGLKLIRV